MGIYENFDIDFAKRTLRIIEQYEERVPKGKENYEVTLLINCLLGLLVLPHERRIDVIPDVPDADLPEWGIEKGFVHSWGKLKNGQQRTLREFVRRLRNSVAHLSIAAHGNPEDISELSFADRNGFSVTIPVGNLRTFVKKLASSLLEEKQKRAPNAKTKK